MMTSTEGPHPGPKHVEISGNADYTAEISAFLRQRGIASILAFSGGADDRNPLLEAFRDSVATDDEIPESVRSGMKERAENVSRQLISRIVREVLTPLRGGRIAVLTGGTKWGVPAVATEVAKELGFTTIGVYPLRAKEKDALPTDLLDLSICVHPLVGESAWGDESSVFASLLDSVIVIGGNAGTLIEVAHILKLNEKMSDLLVREEALRAMEQTAEVRKALDEIQDKLSRLKLRYIIPIYGTGATADRTMTFPGKPNAMAHSIPPYLITSGTDAMHHLINNVFGDDVFEPEFEESELRHE